MRDRDEGFTLVEVVMAMMIILVVATASAAGLVDTSAELSTARQRQWASALASGALEQLRAVPYATLTAGLRSSDLAGDPYVQAAYGGGYKLVISSAASGSATGIDEPLMTSGSAATPAPLYPHVATPSTPAPASFTTAPTVRVYVTQSTGDSGAYTLTSVVTWTPNGGAARVLVQRSRVYSS